MGFFGCVSRPENSTAPISVKNITLSNSDIKGRNYVGGIVGSIDNSSAHDYIFLEGNHVTDDVYVSGNDYVGGLIGFILATVQINGSASAAYVSGNERVGGLVGQIGFGAYGGSYTICGSSIYYGSSISGTAHVGAIIGESLANKPSLLNVFYPGVLNLDPVGGVSAEGDEYSITDVNRVYSVTAT